MSKWKAEGPHQQPVARDGMSEADWTRAAILGARCVVPMTCETPLHTIEKLERDEDWDQSLAGYRMPVTDVQAQAIIDARVDRPNEHDGRSGWYLVRMSDGSLMLACYPHGDTYLETELYREWL